MKFAFVRYIAAIFFITLYVFKGIGVVAPMLIQVSSGKIEIADIVNNAEESEKNNAEEKTDKEVKELYINHFNEVDLNNGIVSLNKIIATTHPLQAAQLFAGAIPTPPPEI